MTLKEYYKSHGTIPLQVLTYLSKTHGPPEPLSEESVRVWEYLEKIWGDPVLLRSQIRRKSRTARASFVESVDFRSAWERWVYSRYLGNEASETGQQIQLRQVVRHVSEHFGEPVNRTLVDRCRQIRESARNRRRYLKRQRHEAHD